MCEDVAAASDYRNPLLTPNLPLLLLLLLLFLLPLLPLLPLFSSLLQDPLEVLDVYEQLAHVADTFGVFGYMSIFHEVVLRRWLPVGGMQFRQLDRRLHINVTRFICRYVPYARCEI